MIDSRCVMSPAGRASPAGLQEFDAVYWHRGAEEDLPSAVATALPDARSPGGRVQLAEHLTRKPEEIHLAHGLRGPRPLQLGVNMRCSAANPRGL